MIDFENVFTTTEGPWGQAGCPECGQTLYFDWATEDYFACKNCNKVFDADYISSIHEAEMDMPFCCEACGGPYPQCMTSCKIFDD